ncbi:hypothetical protein ADIAL_0249 [Alkalibacterium sp. AK22]|uniref:DUF3013 family protein n=1 Tax=Alkalibacterium sp. AK22 TaxID=1229520 RepID=UPI00044AF56C|nr:DUF3013 family protein [Alkalibacterium sp. AK22]EXJ24118.1 hypothetical protein ADIAL_0249 [Alkalibacterium sp. AK22]
MSKENITGFIDSELKDLLPNFKWRLVRDSRKKLVELYFTFHVKTEKEIQVQDMLGQNNEPGIVQFEDIICFYDPAVSHVKPQNYLKAFSFDSHVGLEKGFLEAVLRQLNLITKQGMVELRDFLSDDFAGEYYLKWQDQQMEGLIQTLKDTGRYDDSLLPLDLDEEESFFEKLAKDEADGGVERI